MELSIVIKSLGILKYSLEIQGYCIDVKQITVSLSNHTRKLRPQLRLNTCKTSSHF